MAGFDLDEQAQAIEQEEVGFEVHIRGLDGQPMFEEVDGEEVPVTITAAGSLSGHYRRIDERFLRKKASEFGNLTLTDVQQVNIEKVVACTLRWQGFQRNGEPYDCTPQHAKELYRKFPFVFDQVWKAIHEHENFSVASSSKP